jgi:hypothetical protein
LVILFLNTVCLTVAPAGGRRNRKLESYLRSKFLQGGRSDEAAKKSDEAKGIEEESWKEEGE